MVYLFSLFLSFLVLCPYISFAFTFTVGNLSQCDDFTVEWNGGTGPFQLLIAHAFGTTRNVSIPGSAFSGGKGSFTTQLQAPATQKLVMTMSDSTGFGSGGTSGVLTVGPSQGGSCDTTDPALGFFYSTSIVLQQCTPFSFSDYSTAVQPVTIWAVVPGGTSFAIHPPVGPTSYIWPANVTAGTEMLFSMTDATGAQSSASPAYIVKPNNDSSCLDSSVSPFSSTSGSSTSNTTGVATVVAPSGSALPAGATQSVTTSPLKATSGDLGADSISGAGSLLLFSVGMALARAL